MCETQVNPQNFIDAQADVLRLAKARYALSSARLSLLTEIPETTIASWGKGTSMPAWAMMALAIHIPIDLMNMLAEQARLQLIPMERLDNDLDQLACEASGFTHELLEAKRDGKVTPIERDKLKEKARRVAVAAASVA